MMRQYSTRSVPNIFHDKTHDLKYFFCLVQLSLSHDHELHDQTSTSKNEMNIVNICDQMWTKYLIVYLKRLRPFTRTGIGPKR